MTSMSGLKFAVSLSCSARISVTQKSDHSSCPAASGRRLLDGGFFHLQVCYHPLKRHLQFLDLLCQSLPLLDQLLPGLLSLLGASHNVALSFHPAADSISHSCDKEIIK